jgi:hypothetical protein
MGHGYGHATLPRIRSNSLTRKSRSVSLPCSLEESNGSRCTDRDRLDNLLDIYFAYSVAYERSYYEQVETARQNAERERFQHRVANNEKSPSPEPATTFVQANTYASKTRPESLAIKAPTVATARVSSTEPIEIDSDSEPEGRSGQPARTAPNYSSDIEILDAAPKPPSFVLAPRHTDPVVAEPPPTPSSISVQIRGQEGVLTGSVSSTTTFDAVIKYYAGKMSVPVELPASGRGKKRVVGKKLKIDFDGDLFDGAGKILELDLDGGETLDIKYV